MLHEQLDEVHKFVHGLTQPNGHEVQGGLGLSRVGPGADHRSSRDEKEISSIHQGFVRTHRCDKRHRPLVAEL